jgi:citrate synthase
MRGKPLSHNIMHGASLNYAEFKLPYAAIILRMTVSERCEGIWMDAMVVYFVLAEDGRDRLQRMSIITS